MNKRQRLVQKQFLDDEEAVIKRLKQVYDKSLADITGKIKTLDASISDLQRILATVGEDEIGDVAAAFLKGKNVTTPEEAKATLQSMIQSKVYQKNYQAALKKQVGGVLDKMHETEFKTVSEYIEQCYENGFVGTLYDLQGQGIPLTFPMDQEAMVRAVQLDSKISEGLYTRLGEDISMLKKKITAQVSRGISTGMSYQMVAKQLAGYTRIGYNNAIRIARTEGHRVQCQSSMDACYKAQEKGAEVVKQWDAALDARTRESHAAVDGEIRELDEKFSNGLMFPGDPAGGAAEVINCRCALNQRARWALEGSFTKYDGFSKEQKTFEDADAYNEFKKAYFSKENRQYMNYVGELESKYKTKNFNKILDSMDDDEYKRFTKLQEARPMFNGMYRGDDFVRKSVAKVLTNDGKNDKMPIGLQFFASKEKQFGKKVGKHARDFGLDPSKAEDREKFTAIINDIIDHAEEVRVGYWRGQSDDVLFHIRGNDVVITKQDNEFISILEGGINNARVKNARKKQI